MRLVASGATHPGRVRDRNEDSFHVGPGFYVVADGMGGAHRGDIASETAISAAVATWEDRCPFAVDRNMSVTRRVARAVEDANVAVLGAAHGTDMGTTIVCLGIDGARGAVAWVGDSRCGRLRGGKFAWLTRDHSAAEVERERDRAAGHEPGRYRGLEHALTRALGRVDAAPEDVNFDVQAGDVFLLCSDGIWSEIEDASERIQKGAGAILATILRGTSPASTWNAREVAESVVSLALEWGGRDNCTAVVVRVEA